MGLTFLPLSAISTGTSVLQSSWRAGRQNAPLKPLAAWRDRDIHLACRHQPPHQFFQQELADLAPNGPNTAIGFRSVGGKEARSAIGRLAVSAQSLGSRLVAFAKPASLTPAYR